MELLPGVARSLLQFEDNPLRFERVCMELYREAEGVELVPTSRTWDGGRDARGISLGGEGLPGVLCATLSKDIDEKVEADIGRLVGGTRTEGIVYCTSQDLSERACDRIEARIRELYPDVKSVRVLGQTQLAELGERFEGVLRRHYAGEIGNVESALRRPPVFADDPERIGLRLALVTQTGDDAGALRKELTRRLVVESIHGQGPQTSGELASGISRQLHLSRSVSSAYLRAILSDLANEGLVDIEGEKASLTESGVSYAGRMPEEASTRLLEGRDAIRLAIRTLSGHVLTDDQFERVWGSLQQGLAALFYSRGAAIVRMVDSLLRGETGEYRPEVVLERLADKVEPHFSNPVQGREVRQAIVDMFSERGSDAFAWLTQVCSVYVMMCSLGFETLSARQVANALGRFYLVADSDLVLSLLCEGEENHEEVRAIIEGWRQLNGKLLVARPVLEEVAYHAWIAERDYTAVEHQLASLSDSEANHLIDNTFVRSFRVASRGSTGRRYWTRYISQYRGETEREYGRAMEILRDEYGFGVLPDASEEHQQLAKDVQQFLCRKASEDAGCGIEDLDFRVRDKCRRDALLVAAIAAQRSKLREWGRRQTAIVVSSARLLRDAGRAFAKELGEPEAVLSTAAVGWLLTLTPGVYMGLGTLRGVLFDVTLARRLTPLQRYAYRLIAASEEFDIPWSRRVTLERELGHRLLADARARGQPVRQVRERVMKSAEPDYSARVVAEALDSLAVHPRTRDELDRLKREAERLREELTEARQAARSRQTSPPTKPRVGAPFRKRRRK